MFGLNVWQSLEGHYLVISKIASLDPFFSSRQAKVCHAPTSTLLHSYFSGSNKLKVKIELFYVENGSLQQLIWLCPKAKDTVVMGINGSLDFHFFF